MSEKGSSLEVLLAEYTCLKSEQAQRIGFRDNFLYVTLEPTFRTLDRHMRNNAVVQQSK